MALKAVLFDFNGVVIDDEPIHEALISELLLGENLLIKPGEFAEICLGRSDRACLSELLTRRGRLVGDRDLDRLLAKKNTAYLARLAELDPLPLYPGLEDLIFRFRGAGLTLAVVSGALGNEIEAVLTRAGLRQHFSVIVGGDDILGSKPEPEGYLMAIAQLNQADPRFDLKPENCLAIEDSFAGIQAAKAAGISVVGVAHTYPFHMLQRQANWAIDHLNDLEVDRVRNILAGLGEPDSPALAEPPASDPDEAAPASPEASA